MTMTPPFATSFAFRKCVKKSQMREKNTFFRAFSQKNQASRQSVKKATLFLTNK
jgi:hypothetical protein